MAPTQATPRPLVESNTRERNNDACFESGPAPERRRPGAERGLAAAAALDHGDRANYNLWYESAVRRHDAPRPMKQAPPPPPRKAHLLALPAELQREITAYYCGLECPLPEALERQAAYQAWLAELDDIRHNVKIGDQEVIVRTLRQWAESGVVSIHPRPPVRRSPHPELWHRSAEEIAMYRRQAFGSVCKSTSASRAPDNSSLSHFSAMTRPSWRGRAVRNRHRHAIEQASRRWRGGRRVDSARTRRKFWFPHRFGLFRWRLHYYRTWEKVAKVFRRVTEQLRRLLRPAEEPAASPAAEPAEEPTEEPPQEPTTEPTAEETAEPTEEPAEEPRVLGQPRLLGQREFVPYDGPRYAPYDPELE